MKKTQNFLNEKALKFRELHIINSDGKSLGTMQTRQALTLAKEQGLDLFVISPTATPPIAKILDYGQMQYTEAKRARANHKPKQELKEVKISPRIQQHDLDTFTNRAIKFLQHGDKVKTTCVFKSREIEHPELGLDKLKIMLEALLPYGTTENEPVLQGKIMSVIVTQVKK